MFHKTRLRVAAEAEVKWKQNVLRHSFISYRLAEIQDVNRVALEAGNLVGQALLGYSRATLAH